MKYDKLAFNHRISSENQSSDIHLRKNLSWKFDQADGEPTSATNVMEKQIEERLKVPECFLLLFSTSQYL